MSESSTHQMMNYSMLVAEAELRASTVSITMLLLVGAIVVLLGVFAAVAILLLARRSRRLTVEQKSPRPTDTSTDPWEESARRIQDNENR